MALTYSWVEVSEVQCDADSPLDEILMEGLRRRDILLYEWLGKDYTAAENHHHDGVDSALTPFNATYAAGDCIISNSPAETFVLDVTTPTKVKEILVARSGTLRILFSLKKAGVAGARGRIYRNGVAVGTDRSNYYTDWGEFSEDISGWSAGDLCQIYIWTTEVNLTEAHCKNFYIKNSFYISEVNIID